MTALVTRTKLLYSTRKTSTLAAGVVVLAVIIIGSFLLFSHAASFFTASEVESGTKTANAVVVSDATASSGSAIKFTSTPPTPPPPAGSCVQTTFGVPDGPDQFGGCFPGPSNTGVPAGTVLTPYTGPCYVTTPNIVIDSKTITCDMTIAAANVTVTRSHFINGSITNKDQHEFNYTITDSTIEVSRDRIVQLRAIMGTNVTALRNNASGGYSGGWCKHCLIQDNYFHHLTYQSGWHVSAFRMDQYLTLRHNSLSCDLPIYPDGGCSADMTGYGDFEPVEYNTLDRNLYVSNPGASYCAYGGSTPTKPYSEYTNHIVFTDNVWQRGPNGHCGRYGLIARFDISRPGNVWSGNIWDDKTTIPTPAY
jgi:hypothetical protein